MSPLEHTVVRAGMDPSFLQKHTSGLRPFPKTIAELIWNGIDAKATLFEILFTTLGPVSKGRTQVSILDNGIGVSDAGLEALVSIDFSPSAKDPSKRGRQGNGSKGFVHQGDRFTVETYDGTVFRTISYTAIELIEMWKNGKALWEIKPLPENHPLKKLSHGTIITIHNLGHGPGVNKHHNRTATRLARELGSLLPFHVPDQITITNEQGIIHPMKKRKIVGRPIVGDTSLTLAGSISYHLGVLEEVEMAFPPVEMHAQGRVCDLQTFLAPLAESNLAPLLTSIHRMLGHFQVTGIITIPSLNEFSVNDRDKFDQDLYDDEERIREIIEWMHQTLVPLLEQELGVSAEKMATRDEETLVKDLLSYLQNSLGAPQDDKPILELETPLEPRIVPTSLELEPGTSIELVISNAKPNSQYLWDDRGSGGFFDVHEGVKVIFTAGFLIGEFAAILQMDGKSIRIPISIVEQKAFQFLRRCRHTQPGMIITHTLQIPSRMTGSFIWELVEKGKGKLTPAKDGQSATHEVSDVYGEYHVRVLHQGQPLGEATCTVFVEPSKQKQPRYPSRSEFLYNGIAFELRMVRAFGTQADVQAALLRRSVKEGHYTILINFLHPCFQTQKDLSRMTSARWLIASAIAEQQMQTSRNSHIGNLPEQQNALAQRIYSEIWSA